jgi:hypothetical protein
MSKKICRCLYSLGNIMMVCIIMHNMNVEDESKKNDDFNYN